MTLLYILHPVDSTKLPPTDLVPFLVFMLVGCERNLFLLQHRLRYQRSAVLILYNFSQFELKRAQATSRDTAKDVMSSKLSVYEHVHENTENRLKG